MTLTDKDYKRIEALHNQNPSEKCEHCNHPDGYHHLCKGKKCKCLLCKKRFK